MKDRRRGLRMAVIAAVWLALTALPVHARPPHKKAMADYLGSGMAQAQRLPGLPPPARGRCRRVGGSAAQRFRQAAQGGSRSTPEGRPALGHPRAAPGHRRRGQRRRRRPQPARAGHRPLPRRGRRQAGRLRARQGPRGHRRPRALTVRISVEPIRAGRSPDGPGPPGSGHDQEPDRCLHRRRARRARPVAPARGEPAGPPAASDARPDRPAAHPRRAARLPRRPRPRRLREGRRSPAEQPAIRRALGPALDGRLAVQRLGRLGPAGPRQPAAHLALARLDRRVAQPRQAVRPHGHRDARGRRGSSRRPRCPPRHRVPRAELQTAQPREVDAGRR